MIRACGAIYVRGLYYSFIKVRAMVIRVRLALRDASRPGNETLLVSTLPRDTTLLATCRPRFLAGSCDLVDWPANLHFSRNPNNAQTRTNRLAYFILFLAVVALIPLAVRQTDRLLNASSVGHKACQD